MAYEGGLRSTSLAAGRPALCRLARHGEPTADDRPGLQLHVQQAVGLPADNVPDLEPLASEYHSHAAGNDPQNSTRLCVSRPSCRPAIF